MPTETTLNSLKVHKVPDFETWEENYNQTNGIGTSDVVVIPPEELKKGILPDQTNNSGKFLTTDGSDTSWATVDALPSQSGNSGKYLKTNGSAASWESAPVTSVNSKTGVVTLDNTDVGAAASSHSHGNITNEGDITATAPTIANGDQIIINDNSASKITNGPSFGTSTTTYLRNDGSWNTPADNRDPGYGKIKPGTASSSTSAITANTTTAQASTYNELLTINPGNKWVSVAASNSSTSGSDTFTIGHSAGLTAKTSYGSTATTASADGGTITVTDVKYDEAGHITGSTDRTITLSQSDEIFIAECYVTTFAEISAAYTAGKMIFAHFDSRSQNSGGGGGIRSVYTHNDTYFDLVSVSYSFNDSNNAITPNGFRFYVNGDYVAAILYCSDLGWEGPTTIYYAPRNHASASTTYGTGTNTEYGHVKLSDSTSSTSSTSDGIAATPAAVKAAYDLTLARTKIYTASCSTGASTAAKVATLDDSTGFSLTAGVKVAVTFTYGNSATTPTLNVNSSGAKTIAIPSSATAYTTGNGTTYNTWGAYETVLFTYTGTYWAHDTSGYLGYLAYNTASGRQAKITASGILKGDGSGGVTAATAGTDYQAPLPSQSGNSGKFLTTNGSAVSWASVDALPSQTGNSGKYLTTNGTTASWGDTLSTTLLEIDSTPANGSSHLVTSGGVYTAINNIDALPSQSGNSGKYLTTNGSAASWGTVDVLPSQTNNSGKFLTTNGSTLSWDSQIFIVTPPMTNAQIDAALEAGKICFYESAEGLAPLIGRFENPDLELVHVFLKKDAEYAGTFSYIFCKDDSWSGTTFTAASIYSPALQGTPTAPTAAAGTNTTQIATTAFVNTAILGAIGGSY